MTRFFRWLFRPRFYAVKFKQIDRKAYKAKHNQLADELGVARPFR